MSPDPYIASAGLGDPSSWNRYAYVQGDPINMVDPEGLKADFVVDVWGVTSFIPLVDIFGPVRQRTGSDGGLAYDIYAWIGPTTAQIRGFAELAKKNGANDCDALADFADDLNNILDGPYAKKQFVRALGELTPNQFPVNLIPLVRTSSESILLQTRGNASGYTQQYRNSGPGQDPNGDQGHHFAAFFQVGFWYGEGAGGVASGAWEWLEGTSGNTADIALGRTAARLGAGLSNGTISRADIGQRIRDEVCAH